MPIMQAFLTAPREPQAKKALCAAYAACFVDVLGSKPERVRIQLVPVAGDDVFVAGEHGGGLAMLHVWLLPGRPAALKAELIARLALATAAHAGLDDHRMRILIHDTPAHDIGFGASTAQALGF